MTIMGQMVATGLFIELESAEDVAAKAHKTPEC